MAIENGMHVIQDMGEEFHVDMPLGEVIDFITGKLGSLAVEYDERLIALTADEPIRLMRERRGVLFSPVSTHVGYQETGNEQFTRAIFTAITRTKSSLSRQVGKIVRPTTITVGIQPYSLKSDVAPNET